MTTCAATSSTRSGDPQAVLILDDTGDLKAGRHSVGVQRQYTGTAGRIENAQVSVFLAYASPAGRALIDRAVYLPVSWTDDPARCAAAGVPDDVSVRHEDHPGAADARSELWTPVSRPGGPPPTSSTAATAACAATCRPAASATSSRSRKATGSTSAACTASPAATTSPPRLTTKAWNRYSAGDGAKGTPRLRLGLGRGPPTRRRGHRLPLAAHPPPHPRRRARLLPLLRPTRVGLPTLVRVAGTRWAVETCFQNAKGAVGLDQHQVRRWDSWHRYTTLVMLAAAILTAIAATEQPQHTRTRTHPADRHRNPAPVRETDHPHHPAGQLPPAWSRWRRLHQARARTSHYRTRGDSEHRPTPT